jgi:hypothetical protein
LYTGLTVYRFLNFKEHSHPVHCDYHWKVLGFKVSLSNIIKDIDDLVKLTFILLSNKKKHLFFTKAKRMAQTVNKNKARLILLITKVGDEICGVSSIVCSKNSEKLAPCQN